MIRCVIPERKPFLSHPHRFHLCCRSTLGMARRTWHVWRKFKGSRHLRWPKMQSDIVWCSDLRSRDRFLQNGTKQRHRFNWFSSFINIFHTLSFHAISGWLFVFSFSWCEIHQPNHYRRPSLMILANGARQFIRVGRLSPGVGFTRARICLGWWCIIVTYHCLV